MNETDTGPIVSVWSIPPTPTQTDVNKGRGPFPTATTTVSKARCGCQKHLSWGWGMVAPVLGGQESLRSGRGLIGKGGGEQSGVGSRWLRKGSGRRAG